MNAIGIDIGGTTIKGALVSKGKILRRQQVNTESRKGRNAVLKNLSNLYLKLSKGKKISALGISIAGVIDKKGKVIEAPHIPVIEGINLKTFFPVKKAVFENDANCFTYGEMKAGSVRGMENIVGIAIGTGVGSGIIINKKIYEGTGGAGEIGHNATIKGILEKKITLRRSGDFDSELGWPGIDKEYKKRKGLMKNPMAREILQSKERVAKELTEELCLKAGLMISQAINILAPEAVILGGSVGSYLPMQKVRQYAKAFSFPPAYRKCKLLKSKLGENAAILGASALAAKPKNI